LKNAGINVLVGEQSDIANKLIQGYRKYIMQGMPFITVKYAMSLDGKIASKNMDSKWISSETSRSHVQKMRSSVDAIMIGNNTVRQDNPSLTVRNNTDEPLSDQPLRVIVGGDGAIDSQSNVINQPGNVLVAVCSTEMVENLENMGAKVELVPCQGDKVDLIYLMQILASKYEITNLMVEGGGKLIGSLFDLGLVDRIAVFIAPIIIGGENAITAVEGEGVDLITNALQLNDVEIVRLGQDFLITGSVK
jgi:diaminohydroxyphosphoribosylaminopyrimidine deaminase/5-amino-6-(5-phosphoribosylamino)uracil reductase